MSVREVDRSGQQTADRASACVEMSGQFFEQAHCLKPDRAAQGTRPANAELSCPDDLDAFQKTMLRLRVSRRETDQQLLVLGLYQLIGAITLPDADAAVT